MINTSKVILENVFAITRTSEIWIKHLDKFWIKIIELNKLKLIANEALQEKRNILSWT